jgi:hypothetical protein
MVIVQGDTVLWPPSNVSGNRILAYLGLATIIKVHPTLWIITGAGIS